MGAALNSVECPIGLGGLFKGSFREIIRRGIT